MIESEAGGQERGTERRSLDPSSTDLCGVLSRCGVVAHGERKGSKHSQPAQGQGEGRQLLLLRAFFPFFLVAVVFMFTTSTN